MAIAKRKLRIKGNASAAKPVLPAAIPSDWPEKWPTPNDGYMYRVKPSYLRDTLPTVIVEPAQKAVMGKLIRDGCWFKGTPIHSGTVIELYHPHFTLVGLTRWNVPLEYAAEYPEKP